MTPYKDLSPEMTSVQRGLTKVPEITIYFWVLKLLSTAMGEATSDYFVHHISPFLAVGLGAVGLTVSMVLQFKVRRYVTWIYWLVVMMVSIFGTMAADATHIVLGVPYLVSTSVFLVVLAIVFVAWYKFEGTLSIHSIYTRRREVFYWAAVLATFALGTAAGDMTAMTMRLGFLVSGIMFTVVFMIPAVGYWGFRLNGIFAFWFAYIMTRPVGASFADWFGKSPRIGGLGLGDGTVSIFLTVLIVLLVTYLSVSHKDIQNESSEYRLESGLR